MIVFLFFKFNCFAQDELIDTVGLEVVQDYSVRAQLYCQQNKNLIRWAPNKSFTWVLGNRRGYNIMRIINDSTTVLINESPIVPSSFEEFRQSYEKDTTNRYVGYAAGALYNEKIEEYKDLNFIQKSQILNNRFSFALLSADFDFDAAKLLGLAYEDKYEGITPLGYIIEMAGDSTETILVSDAIIESKFDDVSMEFPPKIMNAWAKDNIANIQWDHLAQQYGYTGYWIEKSDNGIDYSRVNNQPFVVAHQNVSDDLDYASFRDTLSSEKQHYRLVGINSFGMESKASISVLIEANDMTPPIPPQINSVSLEDNRVVIKWNHVDINDDTYRVYILKNGSASDSAIIVNKDPIEKDVTEYLDTTELYAPITSYRIIAYDSLSNFSSSEIEIVSVVDTLPPQVPQSLRAISDSVSIVKIGWDPNLEKDLLGYYLYYANDSTEVFARKTDFTLDFNYYIDTISLKSLSSYVYYKVAAVDKKMNVSQLSDWLQVSRYDTIPPIASLIKSYQIKEDTLFLDIIPSPSQDCSEIVIQNESGGKITTIKSISQGKRKWKISLSLLSQENIVSLLTQDFSGNKSLSNSISFYNKTKTEDLDCQLIDVKFNKTKNQIYWKVDNKNSKIRILRSKNNNPFRTLIYVENKVKKFIDNKVDKDSSYAYAIQAIANDGRKSPIMKLQK